MQASPLEPPAAATSLSEVNAKVQAFAKKHRDSTSGVHIRKRTRPVPIPQGGHSQPTGQPLLARCNTAPALMLSSLAEATQGASHPSWTNGCSSTAGGPSPNFQQGSRNGRVQRHGKP